MAAVRIEFDRGDGQGFRVRQEGQVDISAEQLVASLPRYAIQYPHRAYLDGVLVGEHSGKRKRK